MSRDVETAEGQSTQTLDGSTVVGNHLSKVPAAGSKVCCVCGVDVAGQKRFKDSDGKYWCFDCGLKDTVAKHPEKGIACPDCKGKFAPSQLHPIDGFKVCDSCLSKRRWRKQRQDNRLARAAEMDKEDREKKKLVTIAISVLVAIVLLLGVWLL